MKIFYDGKCSLCLKEINYYKSIIADSHIEWLDIATYPELLQNNITQQEALLFFHVIDSKGDVKIGLDGFICIWEKINRPSIFRFLSMLCKKPIIYQLAKGLYFIFAKVRFMSYRHCRITR